MVNRCACPNIDLKPIRNIDFRIDTSGGAEVDMDTSGVTLAINQHNLDESSHPYILQELSGKQDVINNLDSIISGAASGSTAIQPNDNITRLNNNAGYVTTPDVNTAIGNHNTSGTAHDDIRGLISTETYNRQQADNGLSEQITSSISTHNSSNTAHNDIRGLVSSETYNREQADIGLQQQIDAVVASSDVKDIVGTHADLENYNTSTLGNNDIIKVLQDETQDGATTYYRWSTTTESFTLIGEEGPYYTKSQADSEFVPQTRTINGNPLSADVTLDAEDIGISIEPTIECEVVSTNEVVCEQAGEVTIGDLLATISGYDSTKTQILKNVNGTFTWIDE